jgi:hypothetical protein
VSSILNGFGKGRFANYYNSKSSTVCKKYNNFNPPKASFFLGGKKVVRRQKRIKKFLKRWKYYTLVYRQATCIWIFLVKEEICGMKE